MKFSIVSIASVITLAGLTMGASIGKADEAISYVLHPPFDLGSLIINIFQGMFLRVMFIVGGIFIPIPAGPGVEPVQGTTIGVGATRPSLAKLMLIV